MRQRNLGYERQDRDFYPTPAWVTEALLRSVRCLTHAAPARRDLGDVLRRWCHGSGVGGGHRVVGTDLVAQGYGGTGQDFLAETRLPDGVTAIVTNPPYGRTGRTLYRFVDHALELTRPVGSIVAMLVNAQWPYGAANSKRLFTRRTRRLRC
jgi:hypothetical protein